MRTKPRNVKLPIGLTQPTLKTRRGRRRLRTIKRMRSRQRRVKAKKFKFIPPLAFGLYELSAAGIRHIK